ncbi:hypothetical protein GCM10010317_001560 [Streptomyces mirabilis]|nr:hypothetical protein GCM10010317_001560 [Streptomyces mirabilis]
MFLGQQSRGSVQLAAAYEPVDLTGERSHVADGHRPLVRVTPNGLAGEAELE